MPANPSAMPASSAFEPDGCMALYMFKGAVGAGQKKDAGFSAWAVSMKSTGE
jgi:hypothetical protein